MKNSVLGLALAVCLGVSSVAQAGGFGFYFGAGPNYGYRRTYPGPSAYYGQSYRYNGYGYVLPSATYVVPTYVPPTVYVPPTTTYRYNYYVAPELPSVPSADYVPAYVPTLYEGYDVNGNYYRYYR